MSKKEPIYLDYQSSTPTDPKVLDKMIPYFCSEYGNPHSSEHVLGWRGAQVLESARQNIANLVGANPNEVIFTSGATESNNLAVLGLGLGNTNIHRRRILISSIDHKCGLSASRHLQQHYGFELEYLPVDSQGLIDLDYLEKSLADDVLFVSVIAVNNEIGTIQDIQTISSLCRKHGTTFHTDAAQAPTAMVLGELGEHADLISLSAHKMYGPKGIGALVVATHLQTKMAPQIHGGGQQGNLRSGTVPVPLAVGFSEAAKLLSVKEMNSVRGLRDQLMSILSENLDVVCNGVMGERRHPGNLNLQFVGTDGSDILMRLQPRVCASTGSACTSGQIEPSHVLSAIGLSQEQANASIRISLGRFTTAEEITDAAQVIEIAVKSVI